MVAWFLPDSPESCRTHVIQRSLRPPGGKGYVIPRGFGFDQITCANYTFEVWGWILFAAATWTLPALMFIGAGAGQMAVWAKAKHARLRKVRALWLSNSGTKAASPGRECIVPVEKGRKGKVDRSRPHTADRDSFHGWVVAAPPQMALLSVTGWACAQIFDGKDGREKYPKRWIMLPPFF